MSLRVLLTRSKFVRPLIKETLRETEMETEMRRETGQIAVITGEYVGNDFEDREDVSGIPF